MTIRVDALLGHEGGGEGVKLEEQVLVTDSDIKRRFPDGYDERFAAGVSAT